MSRELHRLNARYVVTCEKPGRHGDGGGLYLSISSNGGRRWVFLFRRDGRLKEMGLGSARTVSLARAREKAAAARNILAEGLDPLLTKRQAAASAVPTFGEMADRHIAAMEPSWKNPKHRAQWRMTLGRVRDDNGALTSDGYCLSLRNKPVNTVCTEDVLEVLRPIWLSKPETASRVRGRIEAVLDGAKAAGFRAGENPAAWKGHLSLLLPKPTKLSRGHHAAMPFSAVPDFVNGLRGGSGVGARALEFLILTAARTGEVRGARWCEINMNHGVWTIPAARMKAGREHRVPLSERAMSVLRLMQKDRETSNDEDFVFRGGKSNSSISEMTMTATMRRHQAASFTAHGFRSSFRDWCGDATSFPRELAEQALAHTIQGVEAAYRRRDALDRRRKLMEAWAAFVSMEDSGNVVSISR